MRTWGRVFYADGTKAWVLVQTDSQGANDYVWLTTLCQCLKLNLGESPFYAGYGIPAQQTIMTQVFPDFYVALMQQRFAPYFSSLIISKNPGIPPTYTVNVVTNQGVAVQTVVGGDNPLPVPG